MILGFNDRFVPAVADGTKPHSIRKGTRWRVGSATVAHVFGGEDQVFRITFRGEPDEVAAFEHLGEP